MLKGEKMEHNDIEKKCMTCANRRSPLCDICTYIQSPDGSAREPRYYVKLRGSFAKETECGGEAINRPLSSERGEECAKMLEGLILNGDPLPIALVMEYNQKINI